MSPDFFGFSCCAVAATVIRGLSRVSVACDLVRGGVTALRKTATSALPDLVATHEDLHGVYGRRLANTHARAHAFSDTDEAATASFRTATKTTVAVPDSNVRVANTNDRPSRDCVK